MDHRHLLSDGQHYGIRKYATIQEDTRVLLWTAENVTISNLFIEVRQKFNVERLPSNVAYKWLIAKIHSFNEVMKWILLFEIHLRWIASRRTPAGKPMFETIYFWFLRTDRPDPELNKMIHGPITQFNSLNIFTLMMITSMHMIRWQIGVNVCDKYE